MNDIVKAVKSLEILDVKVYTSIGNELSVLTRGTLEVLYVTEYDRFVLRINNFQYALSTSLPVMASVFEQRAFRSYVLPNVDGSYLLKLKTNPLPAVIENFETILKNNSQFSYKSGEERLLELQSKNQQEYLAQTQHVNKENQPVNYKTTENLTKAGGYLRKVGESIKQNAIKAAYYVDKNMNTPNNQNAVYLKSIQELKSLSPNTYYTELSGTGVMKLVSISDHIQQALQYKNVNFVPVTVPLSSQSGGWSDFKQGSGTSAKSIWEGMNEAGTIITKAFENKRNSKKVNAPRVQVMSNVSTPPSNIVVTGHPSNYNAPVITDSKVTTSQGTYHYVNLNQNKNDASFVNNQNLHQPNYQKPEGNLYPNIELAPGYNPNLYNKPTVGQNDLHFK